LNNEKFHDVYSSPDIIKAMKWVGHVALIAQQRSAYMVFLGKHKDKVRLDDLGADGRLIYGS
jgi:hypothetical protein